MSKTSQAGLEGENGTRDFLRDWFPLGHPGRDMIDRSKSQGSNDVGDISGVPHTMIECKRWKNPQFTSLLANAEWKAQNAKRPLWFLAAKAAGFGVRRAGSWHGYTTVDGLIDGFKPTLPSGDPLTADIVEELCQREIDVQVSIGVVLPHMKPSDYPWSLMLMFRNFKVGANDYKEALIGGYGFENPDRVIPMVIYPRIKYPSNQWFVYTKLYGFARMLETVGVLPEQTEDYKQQEEIA